ncbi:MAG: DNRLRE domain-containing protein [Planctomycetaceae bacterium]|nr:DNRLRE domain-containing protein [Planctomycetaceae bacterium]
MILLVLAVAVLPAAAWGEPVLLNGDFETFGADLTGHAVFGETEGRYALPNWINLTLDPAHAFMACGEYAAYESTPSTSRYLRLADPDGQVTPYKTGRIAQDLGVMTAGETYIFTAEAFNSRINPNTFQAIGSFIGVAGGADADTLRAAAPLGGTAAQTVAVATGTGEFNFQYTATEADAGNHLYIRLDAYQNPAGVYMYGGVDNARLTVLVDGKINVAGKGAAGVRSEIGTDLTTEYVFRQDAPITINGQAVTTVVEGEPQPVVYTGTQDTYVWAGDAGTANTHGNDGSMTIDPSASGSSYDQAQGFLQFQGIFGSGPGQIAAGTPVHTAVLDLSQTNGIGYAPWWVYARRMNGSWDEDTLTWDNVTLNGNTEPGLQYDGVEAQNAIAWIIPAGARYAYFRYAINMTGEIAYFSDHPDENYGWALPPTALFDTKGMDVTTSEGGEAERPALRVYVDLGQTITTMAQGQTYVFELGDLAGFDQLLAYKFGAVNEAILDLNGSILEIGLLDGAAISPGAYRLLLADTLTGEFDQIILPSIAGLTWDTSGLTAGGDGFIRVIPEPASVSLFALGAVTALARRRRK